MVSDEDVDVETPVKKRGRKCKHKRGRKRKSEEVKASKPPENPYSIKHKYKLVEEGDGSKRRGAQSSSRSITNAPEQIQAPAISPRTDYKVPEELQMHEDVDIEDEYSEVDEEEEEEEEEVASCVQKYVEQLSQGLGLVSSPQTSTKPSPSSGTMASSPVTSKGSSKKRRKKESESSSEEERWLDAIESGKLEEVDDELKKVKPKDPKLMTARQRAMLERKGDKEPQEQLLSLPSGYKEVVMTAEDIQKKALNSQKRKEKADEKREKDKKKTMERLLKKQESKTMRGGSRKSSRKSVPHISYRLTPSGPSLHLPQGFPYPLTAQKVSPPPPPVLCGVSPCANLKRYSCKHTGVPLCSLECYKRNLAESGHG